MIREIVREAERKTAMSPWPIRSPRNPLTVDPLAVGRVSLARDTEVREDEVLTLDGAASLLKLSADAVLARVQQGDLPARRFGDEWRFSKLAVLEWLADGERRTRQLARQDPD
jgi:excisionase family DNA binding protein